MDTAADRRLTVSPRHGGRSSARIWTRRRPRADFYTSAHPGPQDVLLVVEVAEPSADYDRQIKLPVYARAGIPEVWLVDLAQEHVELYRAPSPDGYRDVRVLPRGERVAPAAFPNLELPTDDLLG